MSTSEMPPLSPDVPYLPVKDLILVRTIRVKDAEIETPGGIIIPSMAADQKRYEFGEVVAVGGGAYSSLTGKRIPMEVVVKDQVAHVERAGWRFRKDGVEFKVLRETDVWLIMNANGEHRRGLEDGPPVKAPRIPNVNMHSAK